MATRTWNDEDDRGYWDAQAAEMGKPADPILMLDKARDMLSRHRYSSNPLDAAMVPELEADVARLQAEVNALLAAAETERHAAMLAEGWTRAETLARRERWNAALKSPRYRGKGGVNAVALQRDMGFTVDQLKTAVAMHDLHGKSS